jgi:hypothetical protein
MGINASQQRMKRIWKTVNFDELGPVNKWEILAWLKSDKNFQRVTLQTNVKSLLRTTDAVTSDQLYQLDLTRIFRGWLKDSVEIVTEGVLQLGRQGILKPAYRGQSTLRPVAKVTATTRKLTSKRTVRNQKALYEAYHHWVADGKASKVASTLATVKKLETSRAARTIRKERTLKQTRERNRAERAELQAMLRAAQRREQEDLATMQAWKDEETQAEQANLEKERKLLDETREAVCNDTMKNTYELALRILSMGNENQHRHTTESEYELLEGFKETHNISRKDDRTIQRRVRMRQEAAAAGEDLDPWN